MCLFIRCSYYCNIKIKIIICNIIYCINAIMFGNNNHNVLIGIVMSSAAATAAAYRMLLLSRCVAH